MSSSPTQTTPVEEARKTIQQELGWISSDNYDASFRDSIVLCSHILDTHQSRIGGLEKAASVLAPMRTSVNRVSTQLSDIWGPYAGAFVNAPLDFTRPATKVTSRSKWGVETPRLVSYLRNAPDPQFSGAAARERLRKQMKFSPKGNATGGYVSSSDGGWKTLRAAVGKALGGGPELVRAKLAILVAPQVNINDDPSSDTFDMEDAKDYHGTGGEPQAARDEFTLTLAARIEQLEKLANRHDYRLEKECTELREEVNILRTVAARSAGRVTACEREIRRLKEWVDGYPERYESAIRQSAREDWFVEEILHQNTINLQKSGLPTRVERTEKKLEKMNARLTHTQMRAVAESVSVIIQHLVKAGCLRQGRSSGDPDAQFDFSFVPPEARPIGESSDPSEFASVTYSSPVDLVELQVSLDKVGGEIEHLTSATEDLEATVLTCVQKEELEKIMDLDSEEARNNPEGNPLLRMKANLESSVDASMAEADQRTKERLEEAAKAQREEAELRDAAVEEKMRGLSTSVAGVTEEVGLVQGKAEKHEERLTGLDRKMRAIPNPQAALSNLTAKTVALQAVDGKILGKVDAAVLELDEMKAAVVKLSSDLKGAGFATTMALESASDSLGERVDACLDNLVAVSDKTSELNSNMNAKTTVQQVQKLVKMAIDEAAARLVAPNDTAMATTHRCLGCNQLYPHMHDRVADKVSHNSLPGLQSGPSSSAPEVRDVYKQQYGVMLKTHTVNNAQIEAAAKAAQKEANRLAALAAAAKKTNNAPRQERPGGLKALGKSHDTWQPAYTDDNKLPLNTTPSQMRSTSNASNESNGAGGFLMLDDVQFGARGSEFTESPSPPRISAAEAAGISTFSGFEVGTEKSKATLVKRSSSREGRESGKEGSKEGSRSSSRKKEGVEDNIDFEQTTNVENMSAWDTEGPPGTP